MMFFSELKRIVTKSPILILLVIVIPIFVISSLITGIKAPTPLSEPTVQEAAALDAQLADLENIIYSGDVDYTDNLRSTFTMFANAFDAFGRTNSQYLANFRTAFLSVNQSFIDFEKDVNEIYSDAPKILSKRTDYETIINWINVTKTSIVYTEGFNAQDLMGTQLDAKKRDMTIAWDNYGSGIPQILQSIKSITFTVEQKAKLQNIYGNQVQEKLKTFESQAQKYDYKEISCEYLELNLKLMQYKNTEKITQYQGYTDFNKDAANDRLAVLEVLVTQGKTSTDYSTAFAFGKVQNSATGTTTLDYVFNNLELISIPIIILACLVVAFCIFDDIKKNTVIAALVSPQSRRKVINTKLLACATVIAAVIGIFGVLFYGTALMITGISKAPYVLFAFGGKAYLISPILLLLIYLLSLFFKVIFFASITALLCINGKSLKAILIKSAIYIGILITLNALLTIVLPVTFYQYLPFVALDFAGFFGISFMLTSHFASIYIWFTLPVIILIWYAIHAATVYKFNKKDF